MNLDINNMLLGIAILWPLLLTIPQLHSRLPWPRHLAILPAGILLLLPGDASLQLPWLLFGTGFSLDTEVRWILAMSIILWFAAASISRPVNNDAYARETSFFLLALAGNMGTIFAGDLVTFFSCSTLMGYSFYALLVQKHDAPSQQAGRLYLVFLILADLALFEALLLAASISSDLDFAAVRQAMTGTYAAFYLSMVVLAFAFKAGIWPCHIWLLAAFSASERPKLVLIAGIPVAMGLLGMTRWLPIGEQDFYVIGWIIQLAGTLGMVYAMVRLLSLRSTALLAGWLSVLLTSLFVTVIGLGLSYPTLWQYVAFLIYPFIAIFGTLLAGVCITTDQLHDAQRPPDSTLSRIHALRIWYQHRLDLMSQRYSSILLAFDRLWKNAELALLNQYQHLIDWNKSRHFLSGWKFSSTVFVLLGLAFAWLAA
ncbi:MAG: proton-conducting transporter membrane subunit [Gammaproteobacteria bacterium]|nr:proton-conducting transporter membrane subunit [Gammaproteobacteria bacterium]